MLAASLFDSGLYGGHRAFDEGDQFSPVAAVALGTVSAKNDWPFRVRLFSGGPHLANQQLVNADPAHVEAPCDFVFGLEHLGRADSDRQESAGANRAFQPLFEFQRGLRLQALFSRNSRRTVARQRRRTGAGSDLLAQFVDVGALAIARAGIPFEIKTGILEQVV